MSMCIQKAHPKLIPYLGPQPNISKIQLFTPNFKPILIPSPFWILSQESIRAFHTLYPPYLIPLIFPRLESKTCLTDVVRSRNLRKMIRSEAKRGFFRKSLFIYLFFLGFFRKYIFFLFRIFQEIFFFSFFFRVFQKILFFQGFSENPFFQGFLGNRFFYDVKNSTLYPPYFSGKSSEGRYKM